jgi:hypothetical protein
MTKRTLGILVVLVIVGLGIWAYFWQSGKKVEEEMRQRAEALKSEQAVPAAPAPEEPAPGAEERAPESPPPSGG